MVPETACARAGMMRGKGQPRHSEFQNKQLWKNPCFGPVAAAAASGTSEPFLPPLHHHAHFCHSFLGTGMWRHSLFAQPFLLEPFLLSQKISLSSFPSPSKGLPPQETVCLLHSGTKRAGRAVGLCLHTAPQLYVLFPWAASLPLGGPPTPLHCRRVSCCGPSLLHTIKPPCHR